MQAKKFEAIATLAGGLAHDYNNLLMVIYGNISMAMDEVSPDSPFYHYLSQANKASERARDLTLNFITLARGGPPNTKPTPLKNLLERVITQVLRDSPVQCSLSLPEDLWDVKVDAGQMIQALRHIVLNAREAMPEGGTVDIMAENVEIEPSVGVSLTPELQGRFVRFSIADQGVGIPEETLDKVFDPYYSTKARGPQKGMGLGLAIAHSIIVKHGGHIRVESKVGTGTTFRIHLPACKPEDVETPRSR